MSGLNRNR